jgi:hypothetical protein
MDRTVCTRVFVLKVHCTILLVETPWDVHFKIYTLSYYNQLIA